MRLTVSLLSALSQKSNRFGIFKIGDKELLKFKRIIKADLADGMYNKIAKIEDQLFEIELDNGNVTDVKTIDEVPTIVVDSFSMIKALVGEKNGKMTKKDFYKAYTEQTGCSHRTAERHLQEAIGRIVNEDSYYSIRLIVDLKKDDKKDVKIQENQTKNK